MSKDRRADWKTSARETLIETPVFSVHRDRKKSRFRPSRHHDFYVIEPVDWVNVLPVTEDDDVLLIELYRHGIDETSLEIPGGMIDPEDRSPEEAAARELREETGYASERLVPLGVVHPNPAIQTNRCHSFLAPGARPVSEPLPDETEDIRLVRYPISEVPRLLRNGAITHALVVACFLWYFQHEGRLG